MTASDEKETVILRTDAVYLSPNWGGREIFLPRLLSKVIMPGTIAALGIFWFVSFLISVCAISFALLLRQVWPTLLAALAAILVGAMGLSGRTPLGRLPDVAWSWSNDSFLISMRLGSAFVVPLVFAIVGLATLFIRNRKRSHEA